MAKKKDKEELTPKESKPEFIPMLSWIRIKIGQEKRLRPEQLREIAVFLRKKGLKELEEPEKYEKVFKEFI